MAGRVNLVSWEAPSTGDPYGHGTHVAGIIGGNTTAAKYVTAAYAGGSAPAVRFVDVRVLGSNGTGYTSDVIAGIDWAVANRAKVEKARAAFDAKEKKKGKVGLSGAILWGRRTA